MTFLYIRIREAADRKFCRVAFLSKKTLFWSPTINETYLSKLRNNSSDWDLQYLLVKIFALKNNLENDLIN